MTSQQWWIENQDNINMLPNKERAKVRQVLDSKGIEIAEKHLWNAILKHENLSMSLGQKNLVYTGDGKALDLLQSNVADVDVKDNNHYGTVKMKSTKFHGQKSLKAKSNPLNIIDYVG